MTIPHGRLRLLCVGLLLCAPAHLFAASKNAAALKPSDAKLLERVKADYERFPIVFFLARGGKDACGPACSEWIAAEGVFDPAAARRLRDFLATMPRADLPIAFNSVGGHMGQAIEIGLLLRERRMAAMVARTLPVECRSDLTTETCRRLVRAQGAHRAQLVTNKALCASACVSAFIGASERKVGRGATLGIHSPLMPQTETTKFNDEMRRYVTELGVDAALIDATAKVPFTGRHFVTREELARFGIETRGTFSTSWANISFKSRGWFLSKSLTQPAGPAGRGYQTRTLRLECAIYAGSVRIIYRRELSAEEAGSHATIGIDGGDNTVRLSTARTSDTGSPSDVHSFDMKMNALDTAVIAGSFHISEKFRPADKDPWTRDILFTTAGLSALLPDFKAKCASTANAALPQRFIQSGTQPQNITILQTRVLPPPPVSSPQSLPDEPPNETIEWKANHFVVGSQIRILSQTTRVACETTCLQERTCKAAEFSLQTGGCTLYRSVTFSGPGGAAEVGLR